MEESRKLTKAPDTHALPLDAPKSVVRLQDAICRILGEEIPDDHSCLAVIDPKQIFFTELPCGHNGEHRKLCDIFYGEFRWLSNFEDKRLPAFVHAIETMEALGDGPRFMLTALAPYVCNGEIKDLDNYYAVWFKSNGYHGLSDFWNAVRVWEDTKFRPHSETELHRQRSFAAE